MEPQTTQSQPVVAPAATPVTTPTPLQAPITSSPFGRVALYSVLFLAVGFVGGFYTPGLLNPVAEVPVAVQQTKDTSYSLTANYLNSTYGFAFDYPKAYTNILQEENKILLSDASSSIAINIVPKASVIYKTKKEACAAVAKRGDDACMSAPFSQEEFLATKKILDEATTTYSVRIPLLTYDGMEGEVVRVGGKSIFVGLERSGQTGTVGAYAVAFTERGDIIIFSTELDDNDITSAKNNPVWTTFKNVAQTFEVKN